jgi:hypothetical protein
LKRHYDSFIVHIQFRFRLLFFWRRRKLMVLRLISNRFCIWRRIPMVLIIMHLLSRRSRYIQASIRIVLYMLSTIQFVMEVFLIPPRRVWCNYIWFVHLMVSSSSTFSSRNSHDSIFASMFGCLSIYTWYIIVFLRWPPRRWGVSSRCIFHRFLRHLIFLNGDCKLFLGSLFRVFFSRERNHSRFTFLFLNTWIMS